MTEQNKDNDNDNESEYNAILAQYNEEYTAFMDKINSNDRDGDSKEFKHLPGRTWWGTDALKQDTVDSVDDCVEMCSANEACSGATFHSASKLCWARTGKGPLSRSDDSDLIALLPTQQASLLSLMALNKRLQTINRTLINSVDIESATESTLKVEQRRGELDARYDEFEIEENKLLRLKEKIWNLSREMDDQVLSTAQFTLNYKLWAIMAAICLLITTQLLSGNTYINTKTVVLLTILSLFMLLPVNGWHVMFVIMLGIFAKTVIF